MSRINDFSFSFKEPSKAHRVTVCARVCVCAGGKEECVRMQVYEETLRQRARFA